MKFVAVVLALIISLAAIESPYPSAQAANNTAGVNLTANVVSLPSVTTNDAKGISAWKATLNGRLVDLGSFDSVNVSFVWGTASGSLNSETRSYSMSKTKAFKARLWWLSPNTTYYFQAKAEGDGTIAPVYGDELNFTTKKPGKAFRWFWWWWW